MSKLKRVFSDLESRKKEDKKPDKKSRPPSRSMRRRGSGSNSVTTKLEDKVSDKPESQVVQDARKRLKPLIEQVVKGRPESAIGLVLAILNQETGHYEAANKLIDEYKLDTMFGIKKF